MTDRSFQGKVVLVTGDGRHVAQALAHLLAREGAQPLLNLDDKAPELDREVHHSEWHESVPHAEPAAADRLVAEAYRRHGRLDGLVSCRAVPSLHSLLKTTDRDFRAVVDSHLHSAFAVTRAAARAFSERGTGGAIVLITPPTTLTGAPWQSSLSAATAGILGLVRAAAVELSRQNIRLNGIVPMDRTPPPIEVAKGSSCTPTSEYIASVATYLVSEQARDIHGEILGVGDGRVCSIRHQETAGAFAGRTPPPWALIGSLWPEITGAR